MAKKTYSADDITVLEGLEAVRVRPGMYIGSTGEKGLHHILWEIVDNAIDEAANGYADRVDVVLYKDGSASVEDNGRGMPVDIHKEKKVSAVQLIFTQLHAGGKFGNDNYNYSGGLHGVGASVTNALSEWLKVQVYRGDVYQMEFSSYPDPVTGKMMSGIPKAPLADTGMKTRKKGTFVQFKPDARVFETVNFKFEIVAKRLRELAFLNKGVCITLTDKREEQEVRKEYKYDGGIVDFVKWLNEGKTPVYPEPVYVTGERDGILIEFAIQHTDSYTESVFSFVNNIPTPEGGMHEIGFKSGITKVLNDFARSNNYLKDKDPNFMGEDFREGMTAILSIKMKNVEFEGQTKTKLGNPEVRPAVDGLVVDELGALSKNKKNADVFDAMIKKAQGAAKTRNAARHAKEIARGKKEADSTKLIGKLANCSSRKAELNEIFIVEGDSAGGSAKQGRDRQHQAILPLRGKPLNAEKKRLDEVLKNEEIRTIISALGTGIGNDFTLKDLNYDKVIILSDADQDGAHIRAILLTFFFRYMRELVQTGHVYIGMPPLYKVYKKDVEEYAYDDNELKVKIDKVGRGYQIQRYKGLGEMNPEQLWDTTMNPKSRVLMRVSLEDAAEAERLITTLMGDAIDARKAYIQENADFNKEDTFIKEVKL
ncbi:MAG: type IIA DNA topoisomerase subunit B [Christensenellaceae bacterium]|nr:type IIA DNA topoisomerase subunit B [Christensenellaceae bacterium]MDD6926966.1 DNA topoisomerase subunit B [bacterium]MDY2851350.1 DNA topoisomerase subunit B [Christensenellaceae bacterium]